MRWLWRSLFSGSLALASNACAGAEPSELFSDGASMPGVDAGVRPNDASTSSPADVSDGGVGDAALVEPATEDSFRVLCGKKSGRDSYCARNEVCCAHGAMIAGKLSYTSYECKIKSALCNGPLDAALECDDAQDCPSGRYCCGLSVPLPGNMTRYARGTCQAKSCVGPSEVEFCDLARASGQCGSRGRCAASSLLDGYGVCP